MELRKLYNQFREDKKWMQLGNRSLRKVEGCILKKHGNVEDEPATPSGGGDNGGVNGE